MKNISSWTPLIPAILIGVAIILFMLGQDHPNMPIPQFPPAYQIEDLVYRQDPQTKLCFAGTPYLWTNNAFLTNVPCTPLVVKKINSQLLYK